MDFAKKLNHLEAEAGFFVLGQVCRFSLRKSVTLDIESIPSSRGKNMPKARDMF